MHNPGKFVIDKDLFESLGDDILEKVFRDFIPLHMETDLYTNTITYYGRSRNFTRYVAPGEKRPTYKVLIHKLDYAGPGYIDVEWKLEE